MFYGMVLLLVFDYEVLLVWVKVGVLGEIIVLFFLDIVFG